MKLNEVNSDHGSKRQRYLALRQRGILEQLDKDIQLAIMRFLDIGVTEEQAAEIVGDHLFHVDLSAKDR